MLWLTTYEEKMARLKCSEEETMKLTVLQAIEMLKDLDNNSEILLWFRTKEDMDCTESNWKKIEDDSEALEDTIDEYVNGWIEEVDSE